MAGETIITVVGNLTDDPALSFTQSGAPVANFTVASTARHYDKQAQEWRDGDALFLRCTAWRQLAENVAESLQKGNRVLVTGALKVRQYERQDGSKGTSVELTVEEIGPSLKYATAKVTKATRSNQAGGGWNSPGQAPAATQQGADPWNTQPASGGWSGDEEPPF